MKRLAALLSFVTIMLFPPLTAYAQQGCDPSFPSCPKGSSCVVNSYKVALCVVDPPPPPPPPPPAQPVGTNQRGQMCVPWSLPGLDPGAGKCVAGLSCAENPQFNGFSGGSQDQYICQ